MNNALIKAVVEQLGHEDAGNKELVGVCEDIANHGIGGGFSGFIYYTDTCKFYDNNRVEILNLAFEMAEEFGTSASEMIEGFNCVNCSKLEIEQFLSALPESSDNEEHLKNALAWFAGEEVARHIANVYP